MNLNLFAKIDTTSTLGKVFISLDDSHKIFYLDLSDDEILELFEEAWESEEDAKDVYNVCLNPLTF
ncbi:MAG: hypothetical protein EOM23_05725 [Candidatus Moranbacteria bacterium]|nr:hypothetical protein [Candidatus Moranbacteria bacterium]